MPKSNGDFWTVEEEQFLINNPGYHNRELLISRLDRKWKNIQRKARVLGVSLKRLDGKNTVNTCYSEELLKDTPFVYYWIGFILADGCYAKNKIIHITSKDHEHLKCLSDFLNIKGRIVKDKYFSISISDTKTNPIICNKFDIQHNKTYNPPSIKLYKNIPLDLLLSIFIGYIDGDGCIDCGNIKIECHSSWIEWLTIFYNKLYQISNVDSPCPLLNARNYSLYRINKSQIKKILIDHINKYNLPVLQRKWKKISLGQQYNSYTSDDLQKIFKMRQEGLTPKQIGCIMGLSAQKIQNITRYYKNSYEPNTIND